MSLKNTQQNPITNIIIEITANPDFSEPYTMNLETLHAGEVVEIRPDLLLSSSFLSSLDESMSGYLQIKITAEEHERYKESLPIEVLSFDSWSGASALPEIIASFVTPNRPFIMEIIKQASFILEKNTGNNAMDGYQSGDPNRVLAQLAAIFSSIQSYQITYTNPPASFEQEGQKIRFPDVLKENRLGTCLDLALLYAACAEAIGLNPLIVFLKGHAFPGFWLKEYALSESFQDDKSILTKSMASGINDIIVVESTLLTNKQATFNQAAESAKNSLYKPDYFRFFIDVHRSRIGQIKPISLKTDGNATIKAAATTEEPMKLNKNFAFEKVDIIPDSEPDQANQKETKIGYWQNRLIDMSLRNNLLNYRLHRMGIPVIASDIAKIEDVLAMGKKVFIQPLPSEWRNMIRDFGNQEEHIHSQILEEDMTNNRLRSTLTEAKLEKELVKLYRKSKNTLEESGANSLFIALGFLKWFDPKSHTKERFAPILLLPVDLVRLSAKKGYYIRARDEDTQINISLIEYLKQKFGIDASRLYDVPKDEHGTDVKKIITTMRRLVMPMKNWDVHETASIGVFSFSKFIMWNDLVNHSDDLKKNKVVKSLMEGYYIGDSKESMNAPFTSKKDEEEKIYRPLSSDSTQTEAILATGDDNSFVLHGPPGSGKSQTITNMIAHALATGKTVLFVAEKMAALSVVQKRLADIGLGTFCLEVYSNKGQKKDILAQLESSFEEQHRTKGTNWDIKTAEINVLKKELNNYINDLHKKTTLGQSIFDMIETYSDLHIANQLIQFDRVRVREMDEVTFKQEKQLVENLAVAGAACGNLQTNPWIGIKQMNYSLQLHDRLQSELPNIMEQAPKLQHIENHLADVGLTNKQKNHVWYTFIHNILPYLQTLPDVNIAILGEEHFDQVIAEMLEVIHNGRQHDAEMEKIAARFDKSIMNLDTATLFQELRLAENSWFMKKMLGKNKIAKELKKYLKTKDKINSDELDIILGNVQSIQEKRQFMKDNEEKMEHYFPHTWNGTDAEWQKMEQALERIASFRSNIMEMNDSQSFLMEVAEKLQANAELLATPAMKEAMKTYSSTYTDVMKRWVIIETALDTPDFHEPEQSDWVHFMQEKATRLMETLAQLKDNCHLARVVQEAESFNLDHVTNPYLKGEIDHNELLSSYLYGFYRIRIDEEISGNETLSAFTKADFENKLHKFSQLDDELSELTRLEVYVKLMERVPDLMDHVIHSSEPGILLKAIKSKGRGIAIRQLFERIQNLLPKLKPCMLMSPLSVAQYLDPAFPKFDLVIFDEASQLPTSEAIGAMARGKNVVVVGDPKQLPPTSFFSAQQTEEDFDLQDLESVLDDCLSIRMPEKHLRWHYRSEHESLISYSNNHFYENKLITFPSVDDIVSRVTFRNTGGIYDRGKTKHNKIEAQAIVHEIFARLTNPSKQHESIGVVTFSQIQQTLIEDMIDERLKQDASLEKYFTDEVQEPVFVKNLENVQGDERDVILFSVGYGPDETGHMTLNFGPLNRDGGWRRLNVAISRAKKEMIIFASMDPDKINLSRTNSEGVRSLRAFMEFAKKGNEPLLLENRNQTGRPNSNVIIPEIQKVLHENGYETKTNVGKSDFKIDLAIVDKNRKGNYLAAIQLEDGHRYRNRITTRDRHKLSDLMLDRLGWHIMKVWSIEWWHNKERQIENLLTELKEIENNPTKKTPPEPLIPTKKNQVSLQEKISSLIIPEKEVEEKKSFYEPVSLEVVEMPSEYFYTIEGMPTIRGQIRQIIDQEAPVSFSHLAKLIISSWGFSRSGAKLEAVIHGSIRSMMIYETTEEKGTFLWKDEDQYKIYSDFRIKNRYRRTLADISKIEYANGILDIVKTALRLPKADLIREMLKTLGYGRTSHQAEAYMQEAIDFNIEKGLILEDTEGNIELKN